MVSWCVKRFTLWARLTFKLFCFYDSLLSLCFKFSLSIKNRQLICLWHQSLGSRHQCYIFFVNYAYKLTTNFFRLFSMDVWYGKHLSLWSAYENDEFGFIWLVIESFVVNSVKILWSIDIGGSLELKRWIVWRRSE